MTVFRVILVHIFPHLEWIHICQYSVRMREDADQNTTEYGHFSRGEFLLLDFLWWLNASLLPMINLSTNWLLIYFRPKQYLGSNVCFSSFRCSRCYASCTISWKISTMQTGACFLYVQGYNECLFLLLSYVALDSDFE